MVILNLVEYKNYRNLQMRNISAYLEIGSVAVNTFYHLTGEVKDRLIELLEGEMADQQFQQIALCNQVWIRCPCFCSSLSLCVCAYVCVCMRMCVRACIH